MIIISKNVDKSKFLIKKYVYILMYYILTYAMGYKKIWDYIFL